ncbi:MAG: hypothetical protein SOU50_08325 [Oscillospiraceae bacterium]|nr:hypothetical protein [Oscillospiraceae bacterium]MDD7429728.1 hypothetical protein [Oscillospiraceae bacterium]MDY2848207.1 hypothetical protein [Oscillospiraceae bacterium]
MNYTMNGVPAAAEMDTLLFSARQTDSSARENIIRLNIDAAVKSIDGDVIARLVQDGFSEIAVTTGGKVYEY